MPWAKHRMRRLGGCNRSNDAAGADDRRERVPAIGSHRSEGIPVLCKGLKSKRSRGAFLLGGALAYLDDSSPADALYEACRDVRAFRWRALAALSVMEQYTAQERLAALMNEPSAETRYGAFRALRTMNHLIQRYAVKCSAKQLWLHIVNSTGEPMVHLSRSRRPEVVIFGRNLRIQPPTFFMQATRFS